MSDQPAAAPQAVSEEFIIKVNDVIEAANRIERRFDTHHAQMVMLHAFARYSAHHYRSTAKVDDQANREAFAAYIARGVEELIVGHLEQMSGPASAASAAPESKSDKDASAG